MATSRTSSAPDDPPTRRRLQGSGAAVAGVVFAVLFVWGFYVLDYEVRRSLGDLTGFYLGAGGRQVLIAGGYVVPFAGVSFLWFLAATRHRIHALDDRDDQLLGTVQLATGVLFVALIFVSGAAATASAASVRLSGSLGTVTPAVSGSMIAYGEAVLMIYAMRVGAVFMIATTTRAVRAGLFPTWFTVLSYVAAAVLLVALTYVRAVVLVLPVWVGLCSGVVLFRRVARRVTVPPREPEPFTPGG